MTASAHGLLPCVQYTGRAGDLTPAAITPAFTACLKDALARAYARSELTAPHIKRLSATTTLASRSRSRRSSLAAPASCWRRSRAASSHAPYGRYSSADAKPVPMKKPPVTSTLPSCRRVAVWVALRMVRSPVALQDPVLGS